MNIIHSSQLRLVLVNWATARVFSVLGIVSIRSLRNAFPSLINLLHHTVNKHRGLFQVRVDLNFAV
jgi:hypothetical protein